MEQTDRILNDDRVPLVAYALLRIFLGIMWLYEAFRGAPWAWPAAFAGFLLLIGLFTPVAALLGAVTSVTAYTRSISPEAWGTWPWLYWAIILMHLVVFFTAAGRVWGVDMLLARRRPLWPIW